MRKTRFDFLARCASRAFVAVSRSPPWPGILQDRACHRRDLEMSSHSLRAAAGRDLSAALASVAKSSTCALCDGNASQPLAVGSGAGRRSRSSHARRPTCTLASASVGLTSATPRE